MGIPDTVPVLRFTTPELKHTGGEFGRIAVSECTTPFVLDLGLVHIKTINESSNSISYTIELAPDAQNSDRLNAFIGELDEALIDIILRKSNEWFAGSTVSADRIEEDYRKCIHYSSKHKGFLFRFTCTSTNLLPVVDKCHMKLQFNGIMFRRQNYSCLWNLHSWDRDVNIKKVVRKTVKDPGMTRHLFAEDDEPESDDDGGIPEFVLQEIKDNMMHRLESRAHPYVDAIEKLKNSDMRSLTKLIEHIDSTLQI
jgi:hypothetical protein